MVRSKAVIVGWIAGVLGGVLLLLGLFLPATWVVAGYAGRYPSLALGEVSGTLWHGQAGQLRLAGGPSLGRLRWSLSPAILLGQLDLHVQLVGEGLQAGAELQRLDAQSWSIDRGWLHATPARLAQLLGRPLPPLAGQLYLQLSHGVFMHGWPLQLDAHLSWRDAAVLSQGHWLALGQWQLPLRSQQGLLRAELDDDGNGPLQLHGQGEFSLLGWRLQIEAAPRRSDPLLRDWLAGFGAPDSHGMVHLRRSGGLLDAFP